MAEQACPLCMAENEQVLWRDDICRVILVNEVGYPGFCRVILNRHVAEMTDLAAGERMHVMQVVFAVEAVLRQVLSPDKINLASLGNYVPHLHWHVIPRFRSDPHFPESVWGKVQRVSESIDENRSQQISANIAQALKQAGIERSSI